MTQLNGHTVHCACGMRELSKQEQRDLPQRAGLIYCFQACLDQAALRWKMEQAQLGFNMGDPVDLDTVDVAELEGA